MTWPRGSGASGRCIFAVLLSVTFVLAVATGAWAALSGSVDLKKAVLQRGDLPTGFVVKQTGFVSMPNARASYVTVFMNPRGSITDLARVDSNASLYATTAGAKAALNRLVRQIKGSSYQISELPLTAKPGADARLFRVRYYRNGTHVEVQTLVWRDGELEAVVDALGLAATIDPNQVLRLAQKQERRIRQARR